MRPTATPTDLPCPACHAARSAPLYAVDAGEAAQHYVLREAQPERHAALRAQIERLWDGPTCAVVACGACGFCFAHPYVAGDEAFYALAYEREGYPAWKWEHERTRGALQALLPQFDGPPHLLEVGAGDGAFVKGIAPALLPKDHVVCTEYSDYGRREIERYGIACLGVDVRDLPEARFGGRFDVVCLFQVLEHLDRLDALFDHLGALAAPQAHLFLAVPNGRRIEFNERHGGLLDMPPNHVGRWTRAAFGAIAERHGWRVTAHDVEPEPVGTRAFDLVLSRYRRRRQRPGSLAQRVERLPRWARPPAQALALGAYAAGAAGPLWDLIRTPTLGHHQWVHLTRG